MFWRKYRKVQNFFSSNNRKRIKKKYDKNGYEDITTVSYKIKSIDSARFMTSPLSNLVNNLEEGIHKIQCKDCN